MGLDAMILVFWMLSFKPTFSFSSFTFLKRLFSSSLSAIRVMSSAYMRLLIFLPAILIPAYASSSPAFHMMYFAYKLNKQYVWMDPHFWIIELFLAGGWKKSHQRRGSSAEIMRVDRGVSAAYAGGHSFTICVVLAFGPLEGWVWWADGMQRRTFRGVLLV